MKNWIKILLSFVVIIVYATMAISSAKKTYRTVNKPVTFKVSNFEFSPPSQAKTGSGNLKILLIEPHFNEKFKYSEILIFNEFLKSFSGDLNELLTSKGYIVRGPFENFENALYSDKMESDLLLNLQIDFNLNDQNINWSGIQVLSGGKKKNATYSTQYKIDGFFLLSGKVNLYISEPITKEKVWVKNIQLKPKKVPVISNLMYKNLRDYSTAFESDPNFANPFLISMEEYYKEILNITWSNLDPNELNTLKKYTTEIRENKKY